MSWQVLEAQSTLGSNVDEIFADKSGAVSDASQRAVSLMLRDDQEAYAP